MKFIAGSKSGKKGKQESTDLKSKSRVNRGIRDVDIAIALRIGDDHGYLPAHAGFGSVSNSLKGHLGIRFVRQNLCYRQHDLFLVLVKYLPFAVDLIHFCPVHHLKWKLHVFDLFSFMAVNCFVLRS